MFVDIRALQGLKKRKFRASLCSSQSWQRSMTLILQRTSSGTLSKSMFLQNASHYGRTCAVIARPVYWASKLNFTRLNFSVRSGFEIMFNLSFLVIFLLFHKIYWKYWLQYSNDDRSLVSMLDYLSYLRVKRNCQKYFPDLQFSISAIKNQFVMFLFREFQYTTKNLEIKWLFKKKPLSTVIRISEN